jgi:translation initiation factor 4A
MATASSTADATEHATATDDASQDTTCIAEWEELEVDIRLLRGIYAYGFEKPSPIQSKAIRPVLNGRDVIAQAQSGTGKTGCFAIAAVHTASTETDSTQILILSPTRELSQQTKDVVDAMGQQVEGMRTQLLIGGTSTEQDADKLTRSPPHIVAGCPGRVHDMLRRRRLATHGLRLVVLDEADEMLSQGFKEQVYEIFQYLPEKTQVALFSATMPPELDALTEKFMRNPVRISVKTEQLTLEGISQYYVALDSDEEKYETLKDLYASFSVSQCIIYCNSVRRVQDLYDAMVADDFPVCCIHSGMDRADRETSYNEFRNGVHRVLISSNVTARGIDIQQVSTVINFDIPRCVHTYLHRIGRSGRWGRKGTAINFASRRDVRILRDLEEFYGVCIAELPESFAT